jgi:hypothetical protein
LASVKKWQLILWTAAKGLETRRQKALKERGVCECCLTDSREKETGARCY